MAGAVRRGLSIVYQSIRTRRLAPACAVALASVLAGCSQSTDALDGIRTTSISKATRTHGYSMSERECLARAMFFESIRSSRDGLVAVGTVVMNRVQSDRFPDTICGVVGQKNQFAPGVLSRPMNSKALPDVMAAADAVLAGERHPKVHGQVKFFHQAGLKFPYTNMHYVTVAGGNAFYEKRSRRDRRSATQVAAAETPQEAPALAYDVQPAQADAIAALLAAQERPVRPD